MQLEVREESPFYLWGWEEVIKDIFLHLQEFVLFLALQIGASLLLQAAPP